MASIEKLNPQSVWKHFAEICKRPHPSKHEEKVVEYIIDFAKKNKIEYIIDGIGNVILRKPASAGYENRMGLIMQAHIDMVPQKNSDKKFDFVTDSIQPMIDGDWVTADGTTLGADNGMGAAAALAIMEDKTIKHGLLEALFTIDEEAGMTGANGLQKGVLQGDILLNLDSEDEGELYVGCAGGSDVIINLPYKTVAIAKKADKKAIEINVSNLKGGHSGMEIILQRGNSNKIMVRILHHLATVCGIEVVSFGGGNMRNAIPREASAVIVAEASKLNKTLKELDSYVAKIKAEYAETDENLTVKATETTMPTRALEPAYQQNILDTIHALPNGIDRMSNVMPGLVETSSNMGIIEMKPKFFQVIILARSSSKSTQMDLTSRFEAIVHLAGGKIDVKFGYEGWQPNMKSPILKTMLARYQELYGVEAKIKAIHAGLECGIFGPIYPNWDMISFGPTIRYPHSPDEKVLISSVDKFYNLLLETVKNAPIK